MGEPKYRLNPKIESSVQKILLSQATHILLSLVMLLPLKEHNKQGSTARAKSSPAWKAAFYFWKTLNGIYMSIYHQRSRVEAVFSALKRRYGDKLYCRKARMRRKEMALRFIAYNLKLLICYKYAKKNNLPLWVRVDKD